MEKFECFIFESMYSLPPGELSAIKDKYKEYLDIFMVFHPSIKTIELVTLRAYKNAPKGSGSSFMHELCNWADVNKVQLVLQTANKDDFKDKTFKTTSSTARLKKFYKRFGFKDNYSKNNYRADLRGNMHRPPQ